MAANGADMTDVISFQAYVRKYKDDLFRQIYLGAKSTQIFTGHEGVKGELVLTELIVNKLARRYNNEFRGFANTKYVPVVLTTTTCSVEHYVFPKDFEKSYLGNYRKTGQDSTDYPFQAFALEAVVAKLAGEIELAIWQAVKEPTLTATADDHMDKTFDGILELVKKAITATTLTPVATGAITQANILAKFAQMFDEVLPQYQELGTDIHVSYPIYNMYRRAYKTAYGTEAAYTKIENSSYEGIPYEGGNNTSMIIPYAGMGESQRVIMTPKENLHYGYDALDEWTGLNFEQNHRRLDWWTDFNIGVQLGMVRDGIWVVNDQV